MFLQEILYQLYQGKDKGKSPSPILRRMFRPTIKPKKVLLALYSVEVYTAHLKPVILLYPVLGNETFSTYLREIK
jgi:hypothetical protein